MTFRPYIVLPGEEDIDAAIDEIESEPVVPSWLVPARDISLYVRTPSWLYREMLMTDTVGVVYGPSGVGKSFFMLDVATDLALPGGVVYIAFEGAWGYERRLNAIAAKYPARSSSHLHFIFEPVDLLDTTAIDRLIYGVSSINPRLIIIDTLAQSLVGVTENDAGMMGSAVRVLHRMRRELAGCTVIAVHHTGKDGVTDRGSSALLSNVDVAIQLLDHDGLIRVESKKVKDGASFIPYHFALEPALNSQVVVPVTGKYHPPDITQMQRRILHALTYTIFADGARDQTLSDFTGYPRRSIQMAISHLLDDEYIERVGKDYFKITGSGETRLMYDVPGSVSASSLEGE